MMKTLKFSLPLPDMILRGEKTMTWRIDDEKEIVTGDLLSLCYKDKLEFAQAIVTRIKETTFGEIIPEDFVGHEKFASEEEKYKTYSEYYHREITPQTKLKIIEFKLTKITVK